MRFAAIAMLAAAMALAGCQTTENYQFTLDTFAGATELALIQQWGPPLRVFESGGHRFLVYYEQQTVTNPGTAATTTTTVNGNTVVTTTTAGTAPTTTTYTCTTTFELDRGLVIRSRFEGNNCVASPPTAASVCSPGDAVCVQVAQSCLSQTSSPSLAALTACMRQYGYASSARGGNPVFVRT